MQSSQYKEELWHIAPFIKQLPHVDIPQMFHQVSLHKRLISTGTQAFCI